MQVCNDPFTVHCCTDHGKMRSPLLSAALQNRLAAAWCHCKYTYRHLLFIPVCSDPHPKRCSTAQSKLHSPLLSAALQIRLSAASTGCMLTGRNATTSAPAPGFRCKLFITQSQLAYSNLLMYHHVLGHTVTTDYMTGLPLTPKGNIAGLQRKRMRAFGYISIKLLNSSLAQTIVKAKRVESATQRSLATSLLQCRYTCCIQACNVQAPKIKFTQEGYTI